MNATRLVSFWWSRIWHDEALRSMPIWIIVSALNTSVVTGALVFAARNRSTDVSATALLVVLWWGLGVYLGACKARARASRLHLTLPIASRHLWLSHFGATMLAGLVTLAILTGVVMAHERVLDTSLGWQRMIGPLGAGLTLVVVLMQSFQRDLREPPRNRYNLVLVGWLIVVLGLLLGLQRWPVAGFLVPAALAVLIGQRTLSRLSPTYALVPDDPVDARKKSDREAAGTAPGTPRSSTWTVFSILHHAPPWGAATPWALYLFVVVIGFIMAGGLSLFFDDQVLRVMYLPLASYGLFTGIGVMVYQAFRLEPLPISRQRLFALLMLPTLAIFLIGFGGAKAGESMSDPAQLVGYNIRGEHYWVDLPLRYLSVGRADEVPTIEAPWGEYHPAWREPLFRGSERVVYSPFNTSEESSARFEAMLLSRAVESIYGRTIPADEILERYLEVEDDRPVGFKRGGFTLLEDYPDLVAPGRGPETPVYVALIVIPWFLAVAIFFRTFRAPSTERRLKRTYWAIMGLLLAAMLGQAAGMAVRLYNPEAPSVLLGTFIRQLGATPGSVVLTWMASGVLVLLAYWLAYSQYRTAEMPATPIRLSLVDFSAGDS